MKRICVFCGSQMGAQAAFADAARALAKIITEKGIGLVYGGACIGLMGTIADAVLAEGGEVIGVIPSALLEKEVAHNGLTQLFVVETMHERKAKMASLSDAFIAMPGGFGTFEEFCEVVTWTQLGLHKKACGLLNINNYYDPLLTMFDIATKEQFIRDKHRQIVLSDPDPALLIEKLLNYSPPPQTKWIDSSQI